MQVFRDHIRKSLPALRAAVDEMASRHQTELAALGERVLEDESREGSHPDPEYALIVKVVGDFVEYFKGALDGTFDQKSKEVKGGTRMEELFNETYWNALDAIIPLEGVSELDVWTQIRNSWVCRFFSWSAQ